RPVAFRPPDGPHRGTRHQVARPDGLRRLHGRRQHGQHRGGVEGERRAAHRRVRRRRRRVPFGVHARHRDRGGDHGEGALHAEMTPRPRALARAVRRAAPRAAAWAVAALALLSGLVPGAARAASIVAADERDAWAALAVPPEVPAGETLHFTIAPPPEVEELELLLSVDGGRSYPVRASRSLARLPHVLVWEIPNLPAADARLRIRYRIHGREIEGPPSALFAIRGDVHRAQDLERFHEGNWWTGGSEAAGGASDLAARDTPVLRAVHAPPPGLTPSFPQPPPPSGT